MNMGKQIQIHMLHQDFILLMDYEWGRTKTNHSNIVF